MRTFRPTGSGSKQLCRTGETFPEGKTVKALSAEVMSYDHRDKLALSLEDGCYLLVEETDDDIRELAYQWSSLYEESVLGANKEVRSKAEDGMGVILKKLSPLVRKYIRPELNLVSADAPVAAFDKQGPGIHPLPLLT